MLWESWFYVTPTTHTHTHTHTLKNFPTHTPLLCSLSNDWGPISAPQKPRPSADNLSLRRVSRSLSVHLRLLWEQNSIPACCNFFFVYFCEFNCKICSLKLPVMVHEIALVKLLTTLTSFGPVVGRKNGAYIHLDPKKMVRRHCVNVCVWYWPTRVHVISSLKPLIFFYHRLCLCCRLQFWPGYLFCTVFTAPYLTSNLWLSHVLPVSWKCWVATDIAGLWEGRGKSGIDNTSFHTPDQLEL